MQSFSTPAALTAVVATPAARVHVVAADRADTTVDIRPADPAKGRDVKAAERTTAAYADGVLRIAAPEAKSQAFGSSGSVEVTVQLPAGSHLEFTASLAELRAEGRLGNVVVDGAQGPVELAEAASARIALQDGAITVGRLAGDGELSTQRGDLTVTEAARGTLTLSTQLGDITVGAAAGTSASLDAGTGRGRVSNALKNTGGTPDLAVRATTGQGDIAARSL
ncbi:DUF4097 family beta strand repeat-containing protein [Streptomyces sp. VRA16 Mangrove soil]|uniref:DUF4097 family beta strand repeat-containing protein n=1 Tax=Streptomyces sp. VRA16 Mangrove soil TaxID=2817434 RepID=UPI001A9CD8D4|nr:DUF4097 family beta strand repeat-containing protein [Streptomyces sp. VRA16 Mangrove soil]MBO1336620.1 DUF4097 family beta strand repeat protein [Streptomyces sp. VRA16 Mangrove soil]